MIESIIALIAGLIKAIPIFDRWFTKTAAERSADRLEDVGARVGKAKKIRR